MTDNDLRELLDDAVADVEPRHGLHEITSRTRRARGSWIWGAAGAAIATAAVIAAVSAGGGLPGLDGRSTTPAPAQHGDKAHQDNKGQQDPSTTLFIGTPTDGATVSSPFKVTGKAAAFEGNVQWELDQGSTVVRRGFTTARECCMLSPYSFTVTAPPGAYTLVVHDENVSNGEGRPPTRDTVQVHVQ
jgi:hypothetical protein